MYSWYLDGQDVNITKFNNKNLELLSSDLSEYEIEFYPGHKGIYLKGSVKNKKIRVSLSSGMKGMTIQIYKTGLFNSDSCGFYYLTIDESDTVKVSYYNQQAVDYINKKENKIFSRDRKYYKNHDSGLLLKSNILDWEPKKIEEKTGIVPDYVLEIEKSELFNKEGNKPSSEITYDDIARQFISFIDKKEFINEISSRFEKGMVR